MGASIAALCPLSRSGKPQRNRYPKIRKNHALRRKSVWEGVSKRSALAMRLIRLNPTTTSIPSTIAGVLRLEDLNRAISANPRASGVSVSFLANSKKAGSFSGWPCSARLCRMSRTLASPRISDATAPWAVVQ